MTTSAGDARPPSLPHANPDDRSANRTGKDAGAVRTAEVADAVEVLALVASIEHQAFGRLAGDSLQAPGLEQSLTLSRLAARCTERRDRVLERIAELGGDPVMALGRFDGLLDDFEARTPPSTWAERLLKAYVGYGVADDFCRLVARGLDGESARLVADLLDDPSRAELAVHELDRACAGDDVLSSRLALWGRRLVGEALGVVQRVAQRPEVARVLDRAGAGSGPAAGTAADGPAAQMPATVFNELTAEHTRRMSRLHLTA
ncbi:ferritin-like fold-containing protein [Cellulomonas sp. S1-8]|uniref:ferritin-like fold-containing protein n=1 Tax=Cellulomonas sp. S1-8 TaxID=2904790 RepID=UPI002244777D|nr:ferritin-like fold-containing protein [Cellulomonas sp. S1-8]UZN02064.1 ferritin-like domain-containing protein [Cellulomonas sp. S1-8]